MYRLLRKRAAAPLETSIRKEKMHPGRVRCVHVRPIRAGEKDMGDGNRAGAHPMVSSLSVTQVLGCSEIKRDLSANLQDLGLKRAVRC